MSKDSLTTDYLLDTRVHAHAHTNRVEKFIPNSAFKFLFLS